MTDREAIAAIEDRIRAAYAAGDAERVAAQYTEDGMLLGPEHPALAGREAIAEAYRGFFATHHGELENEIEEIEVAGDWAFVRGRIRLRVVGKEEGAEPVRLQGKYLAIARRDTDGLWRFARDAYSFDHPAGEPAGEP